MLRRLTFLAAVPLVIAACTAVYDTDSLGNGTPPSPTDGGAEDALDSSPPKTDSGAEGAAPGCPTGEGPVMVRAGDLCVDSTEVTAAQYARFVAAVGKDSGGPAGITQCAGNTSLAPVPTMSFPAPPPETPEFPVHGIDWCDAKAYCLWAGKDLCGAVGGGALDPDDAADPSKSVWEKVCSRDGTARFGYGDSFVGGRCVDGERDIRPADGTCEAGYPGIFDMVGNVGEWVDACRVMTPSSFTCALMGVAGSTSITSCTEIDVIPGHIPWSNAGVRCCAPAKD